MKSLILFLILVDGVARTLTRGENDNISPKLDFEESKELFNNSKQANGSGGKSNKYSPKIQGVRVTVDAGEAKKISTVDSGSKESVEIVENKKKKKVEIHTDITFEITDGDESNATSPEQNEKDDADASVPVYKGRGGPTHTPRRPYDPRHQWMPVPSRPDGRVYPHHAHHPYPNVPVYPRTHDEGAHPRIDNWNNFAPITSVWTTERSYYPVRSYQPYTGRQEWKPCYCISAFQKTHQNAGHSKNLRQIAITGVDGKLSRPFSKRR